MVATGRAGGLLGRGRADLRARISQPEVPAVKMTCVLPALVSLSLAALIPAHAAPTTVRALVASDDGTLANNGSRVPRVSADQPLSTPGPQDIPAPVKGAMTLAGDPRPDVSRFLNVRGVATGSLSTDGSRVAYVTNTTGVPQIWVSERQKSVPHQVTYPEGGVLSWTVPSWSPMGRWIAYEADTNGDERTGFYLVSADGLQERQLLAPSAAFRLWGGWSPDGRRIAYASTERNGTDFDIYVLEVSPDGRAGEPRCVFEGKGGLFANVWRPDGKALILTESRGETDENVYLLDLASGKRTTVFAPADSAGYANISWTPDGKGFFVVTDQDRDRAGVAHYDVASRLLTWVKTYPEWEVEQVALSRDGRYLAWVVNENGYSRLSLYDRRTRSLRKVEPFLPEGVYTISFAQGAPVLAVQIRSPRIVGDLWGIDARTGISSRATSSDTGGLDPRRFVAPSAHSFQSFDGETIHGLLYLPPTTATTPGGKPPVLVSVHGGPNDQARPTFYPAIQYLLTRGVAVFDLNFRGSTGYGKRFARLDDRRLRPNAVRDVGSALDWLGTTGKVDVCRAAVMGASYGGFMTFAALTQFPERFRAGVGEVGVSNWVTALEGASPGLKASDRIEYGNIDDPSDRQFFAELSPITHVSRIKAEVMVLHGANDPRDPPTESDQLVRAIRAQGGRVEYLRFPDEGHIIRKLTNRIIAYRRIASFLERTLELGSDRAVANDTKRAEP